MSCLNVGRRKTTIFEEPEIGENQKAPHEAQSTKNKRQNDNNRVKSETSNYDITRERI